MLSSLPARWWRGLTRRDQVHAALLFLITTAAVVHQVVLWDWYIEDAAISFAFARNWAAGEGLVAYAGGELVEGYSNPTWVALLAIWEIFGVEAFTASKISQAVLCALTVPLTYLIAREAAPRPHTDIPLLAPIVLAGNAQFAIWGACGLEPAIFSFFMAMGLWRMAVEIRGQSAWPWSAFWLFLLAISRPEALIYAAIAGFFTMVWHLVDGRGLKPTAQWLLTFWLPFTGYHVLRYLYFAWELPNTYYAKIGEHREPMPLKWTGRGWKYLRNWADTLHQGELVPVYLLGVVGSHRWRPMMALGLTILIAAAITLPGDQTLLLPSVLVFTLACYFALLMNQEKRAHPALLWTGVGLAATFQGVAYYMRKQGAVNHISAPDWLAPTPPYALLAAGVLVGLAALGQKGSRVRIVAWTMTIGGLMFAVSVHGDWMKSWRWMSLIAVPAAVVLGNGMGVVADLAQLIFSQIVGRWTLPAYAAALAIVVPTVAVNVEHTNTFIKQPETGPFSVRHRVNFKNGLTERLHIREPIVDLDVDQGAHLWWSNHKMLDIAGLVDVSMGHNKFERAFIREYLFEEQRPHYVHLHGGWSSTSKIPTHTEWRSNYVEVPGYPAGQAIHIGNFVRRDLILSKHAERNPAKTIVFADELVLDNWDIPSPIVAADRRMYLELNLRTTRRRVKAEAFRLLVFLSDASGQHVATWDLAPGYDWVMPDKWQTKESFVGRFSPLLPADLPPGEYELGIVLLNGSGAVLPAAPNFTPGNPANGSLPPNVVLGGVGQWPARVAVGEVRFHGAITVVPLPQMIAASQADLTQAFEHASAGRCLSAEDAWFQSKMHRPKATPFFEENQASVHTAFAECWVDRAQTDPGLAVQHLANARRWDHRNPNVVAACKPVAALAYSRGLEARDAQDWETAYIEFTEAVTVEPHRAWARRYAEEARAYRLGFNKEQRAVQAEERQQKIDKLRKRRAEQE
ncbi:MAG: hypothetical protein GWP91_21185 [Rhodobacterales bacterium]|nr:hypothetical protein [Rhodobacterales bacterium]